MDFADSPESWQRLLMGAYPQLEELGHDEADTTDESTAKSSARWSCSTTRTRTRGSPIWRQRSGASRSFNSQEVSTMRRDDILALKEQRHVLITEMQKLFTDAETRSDNPGFTAEESEKYDRMEAEFRDLTKRWEPPRTCTARSRRSSTRSTRRSSSARRAATRCPLTLAEYRVKTGATKLWDTPEYRQAWFHYLTTQNLNELDVEEQRVLSKASAGAGANLVPTSFYNSIINILRFTGPFQELANKITTDSGEALQIPRSRRTASRRGRRRTPRTRRRTRRSGRSR
jgi:hypothetical protein